MNNIKVFIKEEPVLIIALLLAIITSLFNIPKASYIDFKVLILLFNLMIVVAGFSNLKVLDFIAVSILKKCNTYKKLALSLTLITFISSMFVTNDVALLTFVPISLIIGKKGNIKMLKIVIFQTLAANLGSSLTPMGNPQNLFIYSFYKISPIEFLKITFPLCFISIIFLSLIILFEKNKKISFNLEEIVLGDKKKIILFSILMIIILLSVFHIIDYRVAFVITLVVVFMVNKRLFRNVDLSLIITFIGFFIFVGNLSNMNIIKDFMENLLNSKFSTYIWGILSSQVMSNVPATMLLSSFTHYSKELLLAVNIGGLGTLIASMASVISYKLYLKEYKEENGKYIKLFTIYNLIGLIIFSVVIYFIM